MNYVEKKLLKNSEMWEFEMKDYQHKFSREFHHGDVKGWLDKRCQEQIKWVIQQRDLENDAWEK